MTNAVRAADCGIDIDGLRLRIDHRRAGDAQRADIAAAQSGTRNRRTKGTGPQLPSGRGVERLHLIAFGRREEDTRAGTGLTPIKRLCIKVTGELGLEANVQM